MNVGYFSGYLLVAAMQYSAILNLTLSASRARNEELVSLPGLIGDLFAVVPPALGVLLLVEKTCIAAWHSPFTSMTIVYWLTKAWIVGHMALALALYKSSGIIAVAELAALAFVGYALFNGELLLYLFPSGSRRPLLRKGADVAWTARLLMVVAFLFASSAVSSASGVLVGSDSGTLYTGDVPLVVYVIHAGLLFGFAVPAFVACSAYCPSSDIEAIEKDLTLLAMSCGAVCLVGLGASPNYLSDWLFGLMPSLIAACSCHIACLMWINRVSNSAPGVPKDSKATE